MKNKVRQISQVTILPSSLSNEFEKVFIEDGMVKVNNIRRYANGANKMVITTLGAL
ncbi:hypothetical protein JK159_05745 [Weissella minor]|nr:hypothetical protein [Weissella minor]